MANRSERAKIATETLEILERGTYVVDGGEVSIAARLKQSLAGTRLYTPDQARELIATWHPETGGRATTIRVLNCTTLAAARRLLDEGAADGEPLCLNFASAKNPGGGFLSGSQAQEECLARATGLYASLVTQMTYYEANRAGTTSLYTDHAIYSPGVPVFRDDNDALLPSPYSLSILTSPAVNTGAVRQNEPKRVDQIETTMRRRMASVLAIAGRHGHRHLVLGAWGCGVFANNPADVARWFREILAAEPFARAFGQVVFAVLDFSEGAPTFESFRREFSADSED